MPWAVGLLALVVGGWESWRPGPWHDEIATLTAAERSWGALFTMLHHVDAVHGLYYVIAKSWGILWGPSVDSLRVLSVLAVAATSVLLTRLAASLWTPVAGLVAGVGFVLLPRAQWSATEARSYALSALLVTIVVVCLVRTLERGGRWWAGYGLALWAAGALFVYSMLMLPVLVAVVVLQRPPARWMQRFWAVTTGALLGVAPIALLTMGQRSQVAWLQRVTSWKTALAGPAAVFFDHTRPVGLVVWGLLLLAGLVVLVWNTRRPLSEGTGLLRPAAVLTLVLGWSVVPLATLELVSTEYALFYPRYLTLSGPGVALLLGACAVGPAARWRAAVALGLVAAVAYGPWKDARRWDSKDVLPQVAATVSSDRKPGDDVLFPAPKRSDRTPRIAMYAYPEAFSGMTDLTLKDSFETSGQLWETNLPLASVASRLATARRIIRVGYGTVQGLSPEEQRLLRAAGLRLTRQDRMGGWSVMVFDRKPQ
ncbi:hypothetical protein N865_09895 [Intrasporangium oryzae NRRL B-24470]|uniref:Uncharacterized protein n=2 Tax=Intrasporangium TaxID=53357 RepID=W9G8N3_9MICO|nr:hypothetical protein N865_09895 [Intrasporangium oryzae NRRL B-24470]